MEETPTDLEDVDMKEIEEDQSKERKYCTFEFKIKVLDYMEDMKVSPYKASEHFEHKYSASLIYKWKKMQNKSEIPQNINLKIILFIQEKNLI